MELTTFGIRINAAGSDDGAIASALDALGWLPTRETFPLTHRALMEAIGRDLAIIEATGRWRNDSFLRDVYVPGDMLGHRTRLAALCAATAHHLAIILTEDQHPALDHAELWETALTRLAVGNAVHRATPTSYPHCPLS